MNKNEFLRKIADKTESTIKDATAFYDAFVATVNEAMKADEKISLVGFGTFEGRERAEKTARNPRTGEAITVAATKVPAFKAGAALKDKVAK